MFGSFSTLLGKTKELISDYDGEVNENGKTTTLHMHHSFGTFLCRHCAGLISPFVGGVNTRQRLPFSFLELRYSLLEFNSRKSCQHLTN